jgi:hypothetical protein
MPLLSGFTFDSSFLPLRPLAPAQFVERLRRDDLCARRDNSDETVSLTRLRRAEMSREAIIFSSESGDGDRDLGGDLDNGRLRGAGGDT